MTLDAAGDSFRLHTTPVAARLSPPPLPQPSAPQVHQLRSIQSTTRPASPVDDAAGISSRRRSPVATTTAPAFILRPSADSSFTAVPSTFPVHNPADARNQVRNEQQGILPVLSAARSFRPSLLLDPGYRRNLWSQFGASVINSGRPPPSQTVPYDNAYDQPYQSGVRPVTQDVYQASLPNDEHPYGNMPRYDVSHPNDNNAEEEMVRRAIEASRQEIQTSSREGVVQSQLHLEDEELARAVSLSMKTAEVENVIREHMEKDQVLRANDPSIRTGSSGLGSRQVGL
ncbi:Plant UBX domain-containing protein 9 [Linum perenne]